MKRINIEIILLYLFIILYISFASILFVDKLVSNYNLIINPIFWFICFIISIYICRDTKIREKAKNDKIQTILIIVLIYLIFYFISGLFFGYSKSPYSHAFISIIKNLWSFLVIIILKEYTRYCLCNNCSKSKLFYALVTILFILTEINFYNVESNFISGESAFKYVSSVIIPLIAENVLFTYLTIVCGYKAVLAYRLPIMFANIILPIFPDLNWFIIALYKLVLSFVCFLSINYIQAKKTERISRRRIKKQNPIKNIPFIITLFIFVGFVAGFFKYMPIAVMSNSMAKLINRGDLVVVEKLNSKEKKNLKQYDIIEYRLGSSIIIHRIIKIEKTSDGEVRYITKGDNNNAADNKYVLEDQVLAKVKFKVPVIGYPIVLLNEFFENTKPDVEMGV